MQNQDKRTGNQQNESDPFMDAMEELVTIKDVWRWSVSRFLEAGLHYGHGTDNPWDDALALILSSLHLPIDTNLSLLDTRLTTAEKMTLYPLLWRRIHERVPVPYLIGETWFAGLPFYVDERVLIPRSPLAELIEHRFAPWMREEQIDRVLDVCTGSGCIAIAVAALLPWVHVDAVDISEEALSVAAKNGARHRVEDQVQFLRSDLFSALSPDELYDVIISNPPYVGAMEMSELPAEYHHEPALALLAEEEGLGIINAILWQAGRHLTAQGCLIVEVGNSAQALVERYPDVPFTWLEFERGGDGVFLLNADELKTYFTLE